MDNVTHLLRPGQKIQNTDAPGEVTVLRFLGAGGQAEVYEARVFGVPAALKWYLPAFLGESPGLWERLDRVILSPAPSTSYLWPYARVRDARLPGFGYLMPLLPAGQISFKDLVYGTIDRDFRMLARIGCSVCREIRRLHLQGLRYNDLNLGNFFFNPQNAEVHVLDNDNVDVDDEVSGGAPLGVPEFAAPELLLGTSRPSRYTDLWSLAVLLFHIMVLHHPLHGKRELLYGSYQEAKFPLHSQPVFIFDPQNTSNAPLEGPEGDNARVLWPYYPAALRNLFTRAFTAGVATSAARVTEGEWEEALRRVVDGVFRCPACSGENIADFALPMGVRIPCRRCTAPIGRPAALRIGRWRIALSAGAQVRRRHIEDLRDDDADQTVGECTGAPLMLRNLSGADWTAHREDGQVLRAAPLEALPLTPRLRIHFGQQSGEVEDGALPAATP